MRFRERVSGGDNLCMHPMDKDVPRARHKIEPIYNLLAAFYFLASVIDLERYELKLMPRAWWSW